MQDNCKGSFHSTEQFVTAPLAARSAFFVLKAAKCLIPIQCVMFNLHFSVLAMLHRKIKPPLISMGLLFWPTVYKG